MNKRNEHPFDRRLFTTSSSILHPNPKGENKMTTADVEAIQHCLSRALHELSIVDEVLMGRDTHPLFDSSASPAKMFIGSEIARVSATVNGLDLFCSQLIEQDFTL